MTAHGAHADVYQVILPRSPSCFPISANHKVVEANGNVISLAGICS